MKNKGWYGNKYGHSLASKGIKTGKPFNAGFSRADKIVDMYENVDNIPDGVKEYYFTVHYILRSIADSTEIFERGDMSVEEYKNSLRWDMESMEKEFVKLESKGFEIPSELDTRMDNIRNNIRLINNEITKYELGQISQSELRDDLLVSSNLGWDWANTQFIYNKLDEFKVSGQHRESIKYPEGIRRDNGTIGHDVENAVGGVWVTIDGMRLFWFNSEIIGKVD